MSSLVVSAAVEGTLDEAVARQLILHAGGVPGDVYGRRGKEHLRKRIDGYLNAAQHSLWLVLVDLDDDHECAPALRSDWIKRTAPAHLCFRVAVREVEAWLLADAERIAAFLRVAASRIPERPESIKNPKRFIADLASSSRSREIRTDIVPRDKSGREVGPGYTSRMIEFVSAKWRPDVAASRAESLRRAIERLKGLTRYEMSELP